MRIFGRMSAFASLLLLNAAVSSAQEKITFEDHVRPILREKCLTCHNTNKKTSDLDLSSYSSLMQGGASGAAIEPGSADNSYLFKLMSHESEPFMPPDADRLPDAVLDTVRKWIDGGAPETASSKVMLPKKPAANLSVDVAAGVRPEGPVPMPDVLNLEPVVHTGTTTAVSAIATSPWAKLIAVAGQKQVILYHSETMDPLGVLAFPEGQAQVLKFSRNGALLLAGGGHGASKGLAVVWDVRTGERVMEVGDELDEVLAADISADQTLVAVGGPQKVVRVYSTATKELVYEVKKHTDWIYSLEFSPDSVLLATSDRSGGLHVWESHTGREYLTLAGHTGPVHSVSWRIDGNVLASGSEDTTIRLWEMENGGQIKSWGAHGGGVFSIEFCRDGRIVSVGRDRVAKMWDQNGTAIRGFEAFNDLALQVSHCDETDRVIAGDWTGEIRVWNAADGTRLGVLSSNPPQLESRVAAAEALIPAADAKLKEVQPVLQNAAAAQTAQQAVADAAAKAFADTGKALTDHMAAVTATEQKLATGQQMEKTLQDAVTALQKAIPELTTAAQKAAEVSAVLTTDEELKKLTVQLNAQVASRTASLQDKQKTLTDTKAGLVTVTAELTAMKAKLPELEQAVAAAKAATEKESATLLTLQQATAAAEAQVAAAQTEVNRVAAVVARWKHYVFLRDELAALTAARQLRDQVQLKSLEAEAVVTEKQQAVAENQQLAQTAELQMKEADENRKKLLTEMATVEEMVASRQKLVTQFEQAQPALKAALEQARTALALLPDDAEIKASAEGLAAVTDRQEKAIVAGKEQIAAMLLTAQKAKADAEAATKSMEAAAMEMAKANEMAAKLIAEAAPLQQQLDTAKGELAAAEQTVQKAQEIVEARRQQIRPQLQLSQASTN